MMSFNELKEMEQIYHSALEEWLINRPARRVAVSDFVNDVTAEVISRMPSSQTEIGKYLTPPCWKVSTASRMAFLPTAAADIVLFTMR